MLGLVLLGHSALWSSAHWTECSLVTLAPECSCSETLQLTWATLCQLNLGKMYNAIDLKHRRSRKSLRISRVEAPQRASCQRLLLAHRAALRKAVPLCLSSSSSSSSLHWESPMMKWLDITLIGFQLFQLDILGGISFNIYQQYLSARPNILRT